MEMYWCCFLFVFMELDWREFLSLKKILHHEECGSGMFSELGKLILFEANFSAIIPTVFETIRVGTTFWSLKIDLFLAIHNCQHKFLGIVFQRHLRMGFLMREPGRCLAESSMSWATEPGGLNLNLGGRTHCQIFKETLYCRKMWLDVSSSKLQRAQREGPAIPLFLRFSAVSYCASGSR